MPVAEIVTIGTEILLGEIVDTNASYLARSLRSLGIDVYHITTVGDNSDRIAKAVQQALERSEIVLTTGGLGPTVDDPSRQAISMAVGRELEYRPELWEQIQARFRRYGRQPTENNRRQAYIPSGAIAVENPVGTAPAFIVELDRNVVISLPGVPSEMEHLMLQAVIPYLKRRFSLVGTIKTRIIHTVGVGESQIDDLIGELEQMDNPTVGLAAHSGQVDVRITAKAISEAEAMKLIQPVEDLLRQRLAKWVYGADQETLEGVALKTLELKGWKLAVVEAGLGGALIRRLAGTKGVFMGGQVFIDPPAVDNLARSTAAYHQSSGAEVCLGVGIYPGAETQDVHLVLITPHGENRYHRPYGGPPDYIARWAVHHSLDIIRNL